MSTKTTFKRVALVAVAAMGLGLLSVVPSSATTQVDTLSLSSATASTTPLVAATTTLTQTFLGVQSDTMTVTASIVSMPATNVAVPTLTDVTASGSNGHGVVAGLVGTLFDTGNPTTYALAKAVYTVSFTPSVAGTYVFKFTPANQTTVATAATPVTWTVTVSAANTTATAAQSTSFIGVGTAVATVDVAVSAIKTAVTAATGTQAATITVAPMNSSSVAVTGATLTASISGPGTLGIGTTAALAYLTTGRNITGAADAYTIGVWADGTAGTSTVTISVGTTVLATETVTFYGAAASYSATVIDSTIADGVANAAVFVVAKDALGNVVPSQPLTVTSSDTTVIASGTSTSATAAQAANTTLAGTVTVTPVALKGGVVTLTFSDGLATPLITATATAVVTVSSALVTTSVPSLSFDKASYAPGEKMTLTLSAVDAAGRPVPNTVIASDLVGAFTANASLQGFPTAYTAAFAAGNQTFTMYAPLLAGDVVVTATGKNTAATPLSVTATVAGGDAAAALEAANDAYDAANYAADAADAATTAAEEATAAAVAAGDAATAAQESADAALAAVTDLGLKVTGLISALRAQITSLTNLIVKIQKKVKA